MSGKRVLLLGATGETGRQCLAAALSNPGVASVVAAGRRNPEVAPSTPGFNKLSCIQVDFDALLKDDQAQISKIRDVKADSVVCALGTTRAGAGGMANFVKIDREYVLAATKAARVPGHKQNYVYCSSGGGANSSSMFPYLKSKGLTEEGICDAGYDDTIIFRPGMLIVPGGRKESRLMESFAAKFTGVIAKFTDSIEIQTPILGQAMIKAALTGSSELKVGKFETLAAGQKAFVLGNKDALTLGREES